VVEGALFDSHCHLFLMDGDPAEAVARARAAGLAGLVCVGIDPESSRRSRELADSLAGTLIHFVPGHKSQTVRGGAALVLYERARRVAGLPR